MMEANTQRALTTALDMQLALKRGLDVCLASTLLLLFAPVLLAGCLAIRLTSPGKAVFPQLRWGLNECNFFCLKLRSMYVDQSPFQAALEMPDQPGALVKPRNDPRVTTVGRWLRRTSIEITPSR